ncbi:CD79A protein, partial [Alectura lathami]|nr:CD79A protein [Alectura lathami]
CPAVWVEAGPPSLTVTQGQTVTLHCRHNATNANVTWMRVTCPWRGCDSTIVTGDNGGGIGGISDSGGDSRGDTGDALVLRHVRRADIGLYFCRVHAGKVTGTSCGTFLRVYEPVAVPFLALSEATKNRLLVAQGLLLLLSAVGPGLLLLFRKRWANERLLQGKKSLAEEENLYEGLNLDECSMYEDISRPQATYQDVGALGITSPGLEKP